MPRPPRIFISFSSLDREFVRKLFYSLKSQQLDVWDYSQAGSEITPGARLSEALAQQIDLSDYFIAVLSANSTNEETGRYTRHEVQHAVEAGLLRKGKVLPLVLAGDPPRTWEGVYQQLRDIMHLRVDPEDRRAYEEMIARLCCRFGWRYVAPFVGDPRLPFARRFEDEVRRLPLPIALFNELMVLIKEFGHKFAAGDWLEADALISYFLMVCGYKALEPPPYYPRIIKGVCELQLGRFVEAEASFLEASRHPAADENSYGGLGQVYLRQRRFPQALAAFEKAREICPEGLDLEARFNILATQIEMGEPAGDEQFLDRFNMNELLPDDRLRLINLRGVLYFRKGRYQAAVDVFQSAYAQKLADATTAAYLAMALRELGCPQEAIRLLRTEAERLKDINLYHHLADLCLTCGRIDEALRVYERELCEPPHRTRQYMMEYARVLNSLDQRRYGALARRICGTVLDGDHFDIPKTGEDFYYDGFANYLLGNNERARYDYERSRGFFDKYYDAMAP
jgi:tetratricopeptide (TPR) repeat protein